MVICSWNEDIMKEIIKKEKEQGIIPNPDIDIYMKVKEQNIYFPFTLKVKNIYIYIFCQLFLFFLI